MVRQAAIPQSTDVITPTHVTKAAEVKASIDRLSELLNEARHYAVGYPGTPIYVQRTMQHIALKLYALQHEAKCLQAKCPDKFKFE